MTTRLTESIKNIERDYKKKIKRDAYLKLVPTFRNLDISVGQKKKDVILFVTDILNVDEKIKVSEINSLQKKGSSKLITSIICPCCKKSIELNKHWNGYICYKGPKSKKREYLFSSCLWLNG